MKKIDEIKNKILDLERQLREEEYHCNEQYLEELRNLQWINKSTAFLKLPAIHSSQWVLHFAGMFPLLEKMRIPFDGIVILDGKNGNVRLIEDIEIGYKFASCNFLLLCEVMKKFKVVDASCLKSYKDACKLMENLVNISW